MSRGSTESAQGLLLHAYPYRETSLVTELFTRSRGRLALIARGARRPRSALRGVLLAFQPLRLSWSGKSELKTLHKAEWDGRYRPLRGTALICGFYVNELLIRLLHREDPHEALFDTYQATLLQLAEGGDLAAILRCFERRMLQELGYGLVLDREVTGGNAIRAGQDYCYLPDRGPVPAESVTEQSGVELAGKTLIDIAMDDYSDPRTAQQSKQLMRLLINQHLGRQELHTRQLLRDLQEL